MSTLTIVGIIVGIVAILFTGITALAILGYNMILVGKFSELKMELFQIKVELGKMTSMQVKISNRVSETLRAVDTLMDMSDIMRDPFMMDGPFINNKYGRSMGDNPPPLDIDKAMGYIKESMSDKDAETLSDLFTSETQSLIENSKKKEDDSDGSDLETQE